jgi:hypothetical protein
MNGISNFVKAEQKGFFSAANQIFSLKGHQFRYETFAKMQM